MSFQKPQLNFSNRFPAVKNLNPKRSLLIFDSILLKNSKSSAWIRKFPHRYSVDSGEKLKDLKFFSKHIEVILKLADQIEERPLQIIAMGGGSVGDFAGFVASVFKRGVDLIQIPSTWLAAIDSAHGGKNALNVGSIKNQIGTFHFPKSVWLIKELLFSQPPSRTEDALGEAMKISLIEGSSLWIRFQAVKTWDSNSLWKILPSLIEAKYKIVQKDPYERKGLRHVLNFGHTVGHVLETNLKMSHGKAVLAGLSFALKWSSSRGILKDHEILQNPILPDTRSLLKKLKEPASSLRQDKKRTAKNKVRFLFLQKPGKVIIQEVGFNEVLSEIKRQSS